MITIYCNQAHPRWTVARYRRAVSVDNEIERTAGSSAPLASSEGVLPRSGGGSEGGYRVGEWLLCDAPESIRRLRRWKMPEPLPDGRPDFRGMIAARTAMGRIPEGRNQPPRQLNPDGKSLAEAFGSQPLGGASRVAHGMRPELEPDTWHVRLENRCTHSRCSANARANGDDMIIVLDGFESAGLATVSLRLLSQALGRITR